MTTPSSANSTTHEASRRVMYEFFGLQVQSPFELPIAGVPLSDPCVGGIGALYCPADSIFADDFDGF